MTDERKTLEVLIVDQFTSTGDLISFTWEECTSGYAKGRVRGGDAEAAATIFGGVIYVRTVDAKEHPHVGEVWYTKGEDGHPKLYKANYDSGD